ncbi:patatin-like phospholipase family protein [Sulfitobacter aestuarii]|uniref:Patatin-like phospholipase family protein n=1 Tax=Sulfitobacter aestuarii TaxID=2161676 RepID=A0ABW5U2K1_9RHOB
MSTAPNLSPCIALVLQGGGARGAYHVGAIRAIAEITGRRRSPFQIICGASVGAINAASIAAASQDFQHGALHLESLWRGLHCGSIYDVRSWPLLLTGLRLAGTLVLGHFGLRSSGGLLDNAPLRQLLQSELKPRLIKRALNAGALHAFCITASSYDEGKAVTFFQGRPEIREWTRARRQGLRSVIEVDHLLASAALPFAFAPVHLGSAYYGDGALRLTSPLSPAIHTGADRILVIATRDNIPGRARGARPEESPTIGDMAGHALDILFNDNLESDHERLTRINRTLSLLSPEALEKTPLRKIETILLSPSRDLREIASENAAELPLPLRMMMRSIGSWGHDSRLVSYLLFETGYTGALIDLGYQDTMRRADEIRAFMAP